MRAPLAVRINDGVTDRMVTRHTRGLQFTKTAPGGHHSASCTLVLPRHTFTDLGPADRMYIYDGRNARTLWDGYTENPGQTDSSEGESFELSAMGGVVLASDRAERLPYLDRSLDGWRRSDYEPQAPSGTADASQFPEDAGTRAGTPGLFVQLTPGQPIKNLTQAGMVYDSFLDSPLTLGAFAGYYDGGMVDGNYWLRWRTYSADKNAKVIDFAGAGNVKFTDLTSAGGTAFEYAGGGGIIAPDRSALTFSLQRFSGGATNVASDNVWACFGELHIFGQLIDRYGAARDMAPLAHVTLPDPTSGVPVVGYLLASDIVEDVLGRLLTWCDPATARVDPSAAHLDQFAPTESVRVSDVFDMLAVQEPDHLWEVLETLPNGRHRFNYRTWPTVPRYVISVKDGYSAPGGEADLCNRITVNWTDRKGVDRTTVVTSDVPALGTRVKDAEPVSLPEGLGSDSNAVRVGQVLLAAKTTASQAGTATVTRPITDLATGQRVAPWEIEPGHLVRVRETGDTLRLTEMTYTDDDVSATLTLGTPQLTEDQILATLGRSRSAR